MPRAPLGNDPAIDHVPYAAAVSAAGGAHEPWWRGSRAGATDVASPVRSSLELCREMLGAIESLHRQEVGAVLDRCLIAFGLDRTVQEVMLPTMREVGARWSRGQCDNEEEDLAITTVRSWLERCGREAPHPLDDAPVVLACGPLDSHTIALETFHVLLSHAQFSCVNLGSQVSPAALAAAVGTSSAQAVVLVSHLGRNRAAAVSALRTVEDSGTKLFYAGAAFRTRATRQGLPGHYLGGNLSDAVAQVCAQLRGTGRATRPLER